ncbi:hypothetical protein BJD20_13230 [Acinetobacter proteolyticus]|uniref:hypothetical protein n=1 Tax=Acinetobacter proteolyticus TaxID=1776741 RepID=UPI0008633B7A|nr:hypothetical protein [Acinetobacter proteolyticus]OEY96062.1 hypothetical protein BJD20_13230 [Acinetobacter proteolyticus]
MTTFKEAQRKQAPEDATGYAFIGGVLFWILDKGEERFAQSAFYPHWQKVDKYDLDIQPIK